MGACWSLPHDCENKIQHLHLRLIGSTRKFPGEKSYKAAGEILELVPKHVKLTVHIDGDRRKDTSFTSVIPPLLSQARKLGIKDLTLKLYYIKEQYSEKKKTEWEDAVKNAAIICELIHGISQTANPYETLAMEVSKKLSVDHYCIALGGGNVTTAELKKPWPNRTTAVIMWADYEERDDYKNARVGMQCIDLE